MTLGTLPVFFVSPHIGVLVFSWLSYMNPHRLTWGFAYTLPLAFTVGAATALAYIVSKEPKKFPVNTVSILLVTFLLWISFTSAIAQYPDEAFDLWKKAFKIIAFNGVLTMLIMQSRERLHALVWIIVICMAFFGVKGGIFTVLSGGDHRVWGPSGSFIQGNNELALALIAVLPLMRYLQLQSQHRWVRLGLLGAMPLFLVSAIGSYSRGALIAMTAMLIVFAWKSKQRLIIGIAFVIALMGTLAFMPDTWFDRMNTIQTYEEDASAMSRIEAWVYAIEVATDSPLWGGGFGYSAGFVAQDGTTGRVAHSIYFQTLGAHGFVGLVLFLMLGAAGLRAGTWIVKRTRDRPDLAWARDLASMTRVGLIGFAVGGAFLNLAFFDLFYHMLAIMAVTRYLVGQELLKVAATPHRPAHLVAAPNLGATSTPALSTQSRNVSTPA